MSMCRPWKWLWALIPLALLALALILLKTNPIESDLTGRSQEALQSAGMPWAGVEFKDRMATLTGTAPDAAARDKAMKLAGDVWGVRTVNDMTELLPVASPYLWSAARGKQAVTLDGHVPNEETRKTILAMVKAAMPGKTIADKMTLAAGAPEQNGWLATIGYGLKQLPKLENGVAKLSDTSFSLTGEAADLDVKSTVLGSLKSVPSGYKTAEKITAADTRPTASPYTWSAAHDGKTVTLHGHVTNDAERKSVIAAAKTALPNARIDDQMKLAKGAPDGFMAAAGAALAQLASLDTGKAALTDRNLSVTGQAATHKVRDDVASALKNAPAGFAATEAVTVKDTRPTVSPFTWAAHHENGSLKLTGHVSDEMSRGSISSIASAAFSSATIDDKTIAARGAPKNMIAATAIALDQLGRLELGRAQMTDNTLLIEGTALDIRAVVSIRRKLRAELPNGYIFIDRIRVKEVVYVENVNECQTLLSSIASRNSLAFMTNSAELRPESQFTLDQLIYVAKQCPQTIIEIAGHTDADGDTAHNMQLSQYRAWSVVNFLSDAGIESSRLIARGYGESRPIAPNDTPENKAKNRRIEFIVRALR